MKKVTLENNEQSFLKGISKVISIISSICRYLVYFGMAMLILCMLLVPGFMKNIKAYDNKIELKYSEERVSIIKESDEEVSVYVNDKKQSSVKDIGGFNKLYKLVDKHSSKTLIGYTEAVILIIVLYIFIISMILLHLSKLFKNINKEETPFIDDNVIHLRKMGLYMIISVVLPLIISLIFKLSTGYNFDFSISITGVIQALFVIAMSFVFKYGCVLQNKSTKSIYDNE